MNNVSPSNRPVPPALRPLPLGSSHCMLRGLAWSPDAELAVAADDSVHVFVPRLIGSDGNPIPIVDAADATDATAGRGPRPLLDDFATDTETRGQFTAHSRHIPVGALPVPRSINRRLHSLHSPLLDAVLASQASQASQAGSSPTESTKKDSLLRGTWNVTNSVVAIAWSPMGVGRHSRSVLGVLTSSGMLAVYGECLHSNADSNIKGRGRQNYDTSQWETLWAAGTGVCVPGQARNKKAGDRIIAFAWTGRWEGPSFYDDAGTEKDTDPSEASLRALLVYMTDEDEIVVLAVFHAHGRGGRVDWQVMEVARSAVTRAPGDSRAEPASFVENAAADVQCSAWLVETTDAGPYAAGRHVQTCLVGYLAGSYVGFLRLTVQLPPPAGQAAPFVHLDDHVASGVCMDLLPAAFLRFEEGVWAGFSDSAFVCRAVVATPMAANELELHIATRAAATPAAPLPPQIYPSPDAGDCTNPITGLVVHPPRNAGRRGPLLYTVVRSAGTPDSDLYETTLPHTEGTPQWADEVADHVTSDSARAERRCAPHVRYCGLAQAPGGLPGRRGVTAVLVELHGARKGLAGAGSRHKPSRGSLNYVLFGWQDALPAQPEAAQSGSYQYRRPAVSTEARMWTYMYGAGPPVVARAVGEIECSAGVAALLRTKAASQQCSICGGAVRGQDGVTSVCAAGHRFARCSATGLAIVRPNASHACGVCGSRTMHLGMLLDILDMDALADRAADANANANAKDVVALRQEVLGDTCKRCGGKFYD